jgi:hypothetical protein
MSAAPSLPADVLAVAALSGPALALRTALRCFECDGQAFISGPTGGDACRRCAQIAEMEYQRFKDGC